MDWLSLIAGFAIGAIVTKVIDEIWAKSKEAIREGRKQKLPWVGKIGGVNKKR